MRERFEEQLRKLSEEIVLFGTDIEKAISSAVDALINKDLELAKEIIENDDVIDSMEREIESTCFRLLMQQQPVASDLRAVSAALKMITDMERIGDHASDICEITLLLGESSYKENLKDIEKMASVTMQMVTESIDAYVKKDLELAKSINSLDDIVDDLFVKVKNNIIDFVHSDKEEGEQAVDLLLIAKYFERIGDHAVNISEWVIFSITGKHKDERVI